MDDLDPLVRARRVCEALGGRNRRTLYEMIKRGDWPPPDRPAQRRGEPDLWRLSTVKRALERFAGGTQQAACARAH
jgi:hypothetical protein